MLLKDRYNFWVIPLTLLILVGCDRDKTNAPRTREKAVVVASVYPLADVARQVGGEYVEVSWLVESGDSVAGLNPSANARARMQNAGVLFIGGASEPWAIAGASQLQASRLVRLDTLVPSTAQHESGYSWLDPVAVSEGARELSARLRVLRSDQDTQFRAQAEAFVESIQKFMQQHQSAFNEVLTRRILVLSHDYDPMLRRFGLVPVMTVTVPPTRLSDPDIRTIRQIADESKTRLLIVPSDTPTVVTRDLEMRASVQIILIDSLGSSAAGGRKTYLDLMQYNVEQLQRATTVK